MRAARIVADHSAYRAAVVCGRVGSERQMVDLCAIAQMIQDDAWLDPREASLWVEFQNLVHVLREIQNDRDITTLSGKARAGTARKHRRAELAASCHRRNYIFGIAWHHQPDRNLSVIRSVCRVKRPAPAVKADFASDAALQLRFEFRSGAKRIHRLPVRTQGQWQERIQVLRTLKQMHRVLRIDCERQAPLSRRAPYFLFRSQRPSAACFTMSAGISCCLTR